jgi:hypothetical protein
MFRPSPTSALVLISLTAVTSLLVSQANAQPPPEGARVSDPVADHMSELMLSPHDVCKYHHPIPKHASARLRAAVIAARQDCLNTYIMLGEYPIQGTFNMNTRKVN